jgi:hypothetical protein
MLPGAHKLRERELSLSVDSYVGIEDYSASSRAFVWALREMGFSEVHF